jgi:autotransporter-associated beta strand protein
LANTAGVNLTISGASETIGSLAGGGATGGNVTLSASLVTGSNNNSTSFGGLANGTGGLTKTGSGAFTLARSAGNTYTGTTTVSGGTLLVNNSTGSGTGTNSVIVNSGAVLAGTGKISGAVTVNNGGHISPGAAGIESLDVGSVNLVNGSILDFELGTIGGIDTGDLLNVTTAGGLVINGVTLNITDAAGMTGGFYTLIDYAGTFNGSMSNISLGTVPSGFSYSLTNDTANTSIKLEVTAPGDFNHDGTVDGGDYVVWRKEVGTKYTDADYDSWRAHFGQTYMPGSGTVLRAVPEPRASVLFLVCTVLALAGCRWRILLSPTRG